MHSIPDEDPSDPRAFIPNVEFYITNVCNLTCSNCNRFNDHDFKGWQRWSDYQAQYTEWAQHVRLQRVTILGGEPLLNPSLLDWVDGINQLWGKTVQVLTNGTRLNSVPDLYDRLIKFTDPMYPWVHNWLGVSLHNENDRERCFAEIHKFLRGTVDYYTREQDPDKTNGANHAFVDSNGMRICVWEYDDFYNAAVQKTPNGQYTVHDSDPEIAHKYCGFAMFKCYHFIRGRLYKCGPVALFPEFDQQHPFDITDSDRELMNSYRALGSDEFESRGREFLAQIDDPIPQCKFCPINQGHKKIYAVSKKANATSGFE
jgi:organic radical activating enzyme